LAKANSTALGKCHADCKVRPLLHGRTLRRRRQAEAPARSGLRRSGDQFPRPVLRGRCSVSAVQPLRAGVGLSRLAPDRRLRDLCDCATRLPARGRIAVGPPRPPSGADRDTRRRGRIDACLPLRTEHRLDHRRPDRAGHRHGGGRRSLHRGRRRARTGTTQETRNRCGHRGADERAGTRRTRCGTRGAVHPHPRRPDLRNSPRCLRGEHRGARLLPGDGVPASRCRAVTHPSRDGDTGRSPRIRRKHPGSHLDVDARRPLSRTSSHPCPCRLPGEQRSGQRRRHCGAQWCGSRRGLCLRVGARSPRERAGRGIGCPRHRRCPAVGGFQPVRPLLRRQRDRGNRLRYLVLRCTATHSPVGRCARARRAST
jgi:hypothetical protein